jgi:hypothetical protein
LSKSPYSRPSLALALFLAHLGGTGLLAQEEGQETDQETVASGSITTHSIRTVLFAGYSDNQLGLQNISPTRTDRTLFFKIGYAWIL